MGSPYERDLAKNPANYQPLSPITFLERAASTFPDHPAIIHGDLEFSYAEMWSRCRKLASALKARGIKKFDTVATLLANVPAQIETHYGVPLAGAVLNTINYRLSPGEVAFILDHGEAKALFVDPEFTTLAREALKLAKAKPMIIDVADAQFGERERLGEIEYEDLLRSVSEHPYVLPADEWDAISLNYTSGTTGNPKGVVYHHRGAHLLALGNIITASMREHPVYLWTVPMFHCNGWCFTWSVSVVAGTHVCLRRVESGRIYEALVKHKVTHLGGAPIVMNMLINATEVQKNRLAHKVEFFTAAAPPPAPVLAKMEAAGFRVTHLYGLTETYGPATVNAWKEHWNHLPLDERAQVKSRQGVRYAVLEGLSVRDPETMEEVPRDGETMGEVMFQGNVVMKGYLKNPRATEEAFRGGWFHSGDLGVWHKDNYIQLKDRSKDIIISGGENISSIEVEEVLYKHPHILEAAVIGKADEKWGETPVAFVNLKPGAPELSAQDLMQFCKDNLARYKCPSEVIFGELPKTSTGKIQKFKLRDRVKELK